MKKGLMKVDFVSVKAYSDKLKAKAEEINVSFVAPTSMPIISVGLVPTYFTDFSDAIKRFNLYLTNLSDAVAKYHDGLASIEGYATEQGPAVGDDPGYSPGGNNPPGEGTPPGVVVPPGGSVPPPTVPIEIPPGLMQLSGYAALGPNASMSDIMASIGAIAAGLGISVSDLFSGQYNHLISQILGAATNNAVFIATITQLGESALQAYLKQLMSASSQPTFMVPIAEFLKYLAKFKDSKLSTIMNDPKYAIDIKTALQDHRVSLVNLNDLGSKGAIDVQGELKNIITGNNQGSVKVDPITTEILKDYLTGVAQKNNITLDQLLNDAKYADLAKTALNEFLKFWLYGDQSGLLFAGLAIVNGNMVSTLAPIQISKEDLEKSGYTELRVGASREDVNASLAAILAKLGLTTEDLYSGKYNNLLTQILNNSSSTSTFIYTVNQLDEQNLQAYLNELYKAESTPKHFVPVSSYLSYLAKEQGTDMNGLLTDDKYASLIKGSLDLHRNSLVNLNGLNQQEITTIQKELNQIMLPEGTEEYNVDNVTKKMLEDFLKSVADKNKISLNDMLTQDKYAQLTKDSLNEFLKFQLHGDDNSLPTAGLIQELNNVAVENNTTTENILNGNNNDALSDYISNTDNNTNVSEVINNMDDKGLQNFVGEIVNENKHPEVVANPVIQKVVQTIYRNTEYIKGNTNEMVTLPKEEIVEEIKIEELPKEEIKEILTKEEYAPKIKEVVQTTNSFNWAGLFPLAGLGLIPLIVALKKRDKGNGEEIAYVSDAKKGLIDANFTYFADSNIVSEESLLDGSNFELLSIYLSQLDSLSAVLNVLANMKDDNLQKYLLQLYNLKFEHVWSGNSLIIKILFNDLSRIASKQGIDLSTLLSNSNYVVWVKTSIVDIAKMYTKYEEDINTSGGFKLFLSSVLGKSIIVNQENYQILNTFLELSAKNLGINIEALLNQISEFNNKLTIFAIIRYGEGVKPYLFGFINSLYQEIPNDKEYDNLSKTEFDERVLTDLGYLSLLFNSTDEQIEKTIDKVLEKYKISKSDLYGGNKENFFNNLINKSNNLTLTLYLLTKMDAFKLQFYLHTLQTTSNDNKFILITMKFLEYLAKSENTNIDSLLTDIKYANIIKDALTNFKKSVLGIYSLSKKDDMSLNEQINNLFFMEDISPYGMDKITVEMLKEMLSNLAKTKEIGFNSLLDIKNITTLREFIEKIIGIIMFISKVQNKDSSSNNLSKLPDQTIKQDSTPKPIEDKLGGFANVSRVSKESLLDGSNLGLLTVYLQKLDNINAVIDVLVEMKDNVLQVYLKELYSKSFNNKFIQMILKFLGYYATSENTNLESLLSDPKYASSIKEALKDFGKSILNFNSLSKIDHNELNKEINNLFISENTSIYGIDKVTREMVKLMLSESTNTDNVDINSLLDPKNSNVLKKLLQRVINNIMFLNVETKENLNVNISPNNMSTNKEDIIKSLQLAFRNESVGDPILKTKLKNYMTIMNIDSGLTFEEYLYAQEFNNFIKINFDNSNILTLIYTYLGSGINYNFDISRKFEEIASKNSLNLSELKSVNGVSFIVENIIKENNILFTLESILNTDKEVSYATIKNLYNIKENSNINKLFEYIDENLKRPKNKLLEEFLEEEQNLKAIVQFLLKILVILLMLMLLSNKKEEVK